MAANSSTPLLHNPHVGMYCLNTEPSKFIFTALYITSIFLLPVFLFVLYLGLQRWWQQRSTSSAATANHSDSFACHMAAIELIGIFGCTLCCGGIYGDHITLLSVGYFLWSFTWYGQTFFHMLTCAERYLAVVHPVTYLSLRGGRGIRIRNITVGCVWPLCFGGTALILIDFIYIDVCLLIFYFVVICFCSLSVLCVLIHPGPGEQGGDRERVDKSKRRAFYTIVAILGVLVVRCCAGIVWLALYVLNESNTCAIMTSEAWFTYTSRLVLPLLFLHRSGKLACCKNNA